MRLLHIDIVSFVTVVREIVDSKISFTTVSVDDVWVVVVVVVAVVDEDDTLIVVISSIYAASIDGSLKFGLTKTYNFGN